MITQERKPWSLLIYIAGDNNLSDAGLKDIRELCAVGASENTHVGVEIDTYGEYTGSIRYEITEKDWTGKAHRTVIERLPERDTGDPATFRDFLKWGSGRYHGEKQLVVVWNHGAGFRTARRDIAYDDYGSSLDMPEIVTALSQAGFGADNKLSIVGFDACLMSMLEIANHLRDHADYLVGSQEVEPGDGWPYHDVLQLANGNPTAEQMAVGIVEAYIKSYQEIAIGNVTQSAIDVAATERAVQAWNNLGDLLTEKQRTELRVMQGVRMRAQAYHMADYVDLSHLCQLVTELSADNSVQMAAGNAAEVLGGCVKRARHFGSQVSDSHGLSVWFPHFSNLYFANRSKYLALRCNSETSGWVRFLDAYHGAYV